MPAPTNPSAPTAPVAPLKKKSRRKLFIVLGVLAVIVIAAVAFSASRNKDAGIPVTTEKAIVKTITQLVTATGKVQPEIEVKISPEVAGEITAIPIKEGGSVKKGDLLVSIRPDQYQAQVDQQEANLVAARATAVQAKSQLVKATDDFKRSADLFAKKLISDSDYDAARSNLEVAQANYDNASAQIRRTEGSLSQFRDQLSKTTIYSPMDGSISSLSSEIGERVVGTGSFAGTEIMRVADLSNMEVRIKVNENDIVNVKLGDHALISIDAYPGRKFTGAVKEISSSAAGTGATGSGNNAVPTDDVTNFLVKIRITDRDASLRPGMSGTVDIETQTVTNVVAIPVQSVTVRAAGGKTSEELQQAKAKEAKERSGNDLDLAKEKEDARRNLEKLDRVVFVKTGDTVKLRKVETGIADNASIEVKSGLKAGEEVVSGSYAAISRKLKDGSKVMIEKPKKEEAAK
ncbi:efflux RND transporter periplasmic adaptor subunit [Opitutus sp. GAS368]|uniref:efflux RND transporter periplasmic adaptor subunit n=1 Tax=Opitutus sp. GAS368 TaxID=1882749 RepID=UPI00087DD9AC|nr:efflux RND transporter periplasmic adaptor subunit [Opitutus sp. GAS368]SDS28605.1 HlyD family secretion protein [Opitutus sp. GAS368]